MHSERRIAFGIIALAIACGLAVVLFAPAAKANNTDIMHLRTAAAVCVSVCILGGALFFLAGTQKFKLRLKIAYILMVIGFILVGVGLLQLPVIGFFDLWDSWIITSGVSILPFVLATVFIYLGLKRFAFLLNIKGLTTSFWVVSVTALLGTAVAFAAGHYLARYRYITGTDLYIAIVSWSTLYSTFATLLARSIVKHIGLSYRHAMRWLLIALLVLTLAGWHEVISNFFIGNSSWYVAHGLSYVPFIISGLLIVRAAYTFSLLSQAVPYIAVREAPRTDLPGADVQAIASLAALVSTTDTSNPAVQDIQTTMSRLITPDQQTPAPASQEKLLTAYKKIETYLMHDDPLRSFGQQELRGALRPGFRAAVEQRDPQATDKQ